MELKLPFDGEIASDDINVGSVILFSLLNGRGWKIRSWDWLAGFHFVFSGGVELRWDNQPFEVFSDG